jgi:hypothetical protein
MHGTLAYMPVAIIKVIPYWTFGLLVLAITAYPIIAMGREKSMMTPRSLRRSERNATKTENKRKKGKVNIDKIAYG